MCARVPLEGRVGRQGGCEVAPKPGEDPAEEQGAGIWDSLGWEGGDFLTNVGKLQDAAACSHQSLSDL